MFILVATVGLAVSHLRAKVLRIDADFPGGNIVLEKITGAFSRDLVRAAPLPSNGAPNPHHPMTPTKRFVPIGIALALASISRAQSAPAAPATNALADADVVVLNPFTVETSTDRGYLATQTLAGTRLRTNIADTP